LTRYNSLDTAPAKEFRERAGVALAGWQGAKEPHALSWLDASRRITSGIGGEYEGFRRGIQGV
jgi:hypothetical protein